LKKGSACTELFADATVGDCLAVKTKWEASRKLVSVKPDATLSDALHILLQSKILSLPIVSDDNRCLGIVDVIDILHYLVTELNSVQDWTSWSSVKLDDLLKGVQIYSLCDFSRGDPLVLVGENTSLSSLIKFLCSGLSHRALVHTKDGFEICSQTDVFAFLAESLNTNRALAEHIDSIPVVGNLRNRSLEEKDIVTAKESMPVFEVMKLMKEKQVSAVAIVDDAGRLSGNFSAVDLVQLNLLTLNDIGIPVAEYLRKHVKQLNPLAVETDITLGQAVMLLAMLRMHRVWIVDSKYLERFKPVGVFTMTDLLHMLFVL